VQIDAKQHELCLSPGQQAWRKLRRSRVAMGSLGTLIGVSLLAVMTPLLPLQPPDRSQVSLQYHAPSIRPLWLHHFHLDLKQIAQSELKAQHLRAELKDDLPELDRRITASREQLQRTTAKLNQIPDLSSRQHQLQLAPAKIACSHAVQARRQAFARIDDLIQRPYRQLGFAELNRLSRQMVRIRFALFGDRSLNALCGRDLLGRDLLSRLFWGARISLLVGLVATVVSLVIGVSYGAISGYLGGWVDQAMMRLVDIGYSIPFIFVVIYFITILGEEEISTVLADYGIDRITIFYFVVGAIYWLTMARVVRGQVLSIKTELYIEAARALGIPQWRIIFLHVMPNLMSVVIVYLTLTIPRVMLFEAFLSFLGLGVEPPDVSWGLLANEGIKVITPIKIYWWLVLFPSLALGITLIALNFLGDRLRDALDPRLRSVGS
jgi:oligopeptide transport system permease protein